jgi:hypothetical protein
MKNNELFTVKQNLKQYYGRTVTKEMRFEESTQDGTVHQTLENCVLTTEIRREWERGAIKNNLYSKQTEQLPEGTVLIWSEDEGYIVPNVPFYKLSDLEKEIKEVKEIYKDNTDMNPTVE